MTNVQKRNLVIVRAGVSSLHEKWLLDEDHVRNFEIVVSCYSEDAYRYFKESSADKVMFVPGGKWDGLFETFRSINIKNYDYFWLPDDDIDAEVADINSIFNESATFGLRVSQPSLRWGSFYSHLILHHSKSFRLRYSNFVEIMVPCLHLTVVEEMMPYFANSKSGFGFDYIWCRLGSSGAFRCGILDSIQVEHTRPLGAELQRTMAINGKITPQQERAAINEVFGVDTVPTPIVFAGVRANSEPVTGRLTCGILIARDFLRERCPRTGAVPSFGAVLKHMRRQSLKSLTMRVLPGSRNTHGIER